MDSLSHQYPPQHLHDSGIYHSQTHPHTSSLVSQLDLDPTDPFPFPTHLETHLQSLQPRTAFDQGPLPRFHEIQSLTNTTSHEHNVYNRGGSYGVLTPHHQLPSQLQPHSETTERPQNETDSRSAPTQSFGGTKRHLENLKIIPNPPDLEQWRNKLFDVDGLITMTEDQYAWLTWIFWSYVG